MSNAGIEQLRSIKVPENFAANKVLVDQMIARAEKGDGSDQSAAESVGLLLMAHLELLEWVSNLHEAANRPLR